MRWVIAGGQPIRIHRLGLRLPALDYPLGLISFEGDLHALVMIRTVLEVHCEAVRELEHTIVSVCRN